MPIIYKILLVFAGGGVGAVCRLLIELWLKPSGLWMGFGTWVINSSACFIIGILAGMLGVADWNDHTKQIIALLTMTGFCGGYSTFSSFTLDCVKYFENGHLMIWVIFGTATVFVGLFACALGYWLGKQIV